MKSLKSLAIIFIAAFVALFAGAIQGHAAPGDITTVAGNGTQGNSGDGGPATSASLYWSADVAIDSTGNVYIADTQNHSIRKVATNGVITTVAGTGTAGFSGDNGPATSASLYSPNGIAVDSSGNIYIADTGSHRVRKVAANGVITTVAGGGFAGLGDGGPATSAQLSYPQRVAVDSIGNVYIADMSNQRIRKVGTDGVITTFAGNGTAGFSGDNGQATSAQLNYPRGVAIDSTGNIYIVDQNNQRIRRVATNGVITTVAGNGVAGFSGNNGQATSASLNWPYGVAIDSVGNVYIADTSNHRIRKVGTDGVITTVAGTGTGGFSGDNGPATSAKLYNPYAVAIDSIGNVYISDYSNHRIRKVQGVTANGTYAWNSVTGELTLNTANSSFVCNGLFVGTEIITGVAITTDTMTGVDFPTWTRSPVGAANDPVGVWTASDTGNSYTLTINSDGTFSLAAVIVACSGGGGQPFFAYSGHESDGHYHGYFHADDPTHQYTSVTVTGPYITGSLNLTYDTTYCNPGCWAIFGGGVDFGTTAPVAPLDYIITATDAGGSTPHPVSITGFVADYATNLAPSGPVSVPPTFTWTGVTGSDTYGVRVMDTSWNNVWEAWNLTATSIPYAGPALTWGMTYYYTVQVNIQSNFSTATGSFLYGTPTPDLTVTAMSAPGSVQAGMSGAISATIANGGSASAAFTYMRFYISADSVITTADTKLTATSLVVSGLGAGASQVVNANVIIPGLAPGVYYIGAIADVTGKVAEVSETNNTASAPVTITSGVDLTVSSVSAPASAQAGTSAAISATIANIGSASAAFTYMRFYISPDATITTADTKLTATSLVVSGLGAGASQVINANVTIPSLAPGTYYIGAIADVTGKVAEMNEGNNANLKAIDVTSGVDLTVTLVTAPASAQAGSSQAISATITNSGTATSAFTYMRFYISPDAVITTADTKLTATSLVVSGLGAGASQVINANVTIPSLAPGTYYIGAIADVTGKVPEINEGNNTNLKAIDITTP